LTVALDVSIEAIKEMIRRKERIPISQQRLRYGGKQLEDGKGLGDYHILGESTVHLMLRPCGGEGSEQGHDCVGSSRKRLGDNKGAVEQGAVNKLQIGCQLRLVEKQADMRQRWAKERAERDMALLKLKHAQTTLKLMQAESAEKDAELARREEEVRVHLDKTRSMQEQMECMLGQESAEYVRGLRQKLKEELAVLQAAEKHWRTEWYQQGAELATEKLKSARLEAELVAEKSKLVADKSKCARLTSEVATEKLITLRLSARLTSELATEKQKSANFEVTALRLNSELVTEKQKSANLKAELVEQNSKLVHLNSKFASIQAKLEETVLEAE
jgi:hypothetical protein